MSKRIISLMLAAVMLFGVLASTTACGNKTETPDALVIMTEELDGLFNPFFSTTGADANIVGMTQIGMLGSTYENGDVKVAFGKDHAVAVLDYVQTYDAATDKTTYTFVLKNDVVYSDGHPMTMEDVLFNLYVYLDPVYTGSSTMYSTDIVGLQDYRTQTIGSGSNNVDVHHSPHPFRRTHIPRPIDTNYACMPVSNSSRHIRRYHRRHRPQKAAHIASRNRE